jgi:ubiquitin carboxyl-terminal hydrolase L5
VLQRRIGRYPATEIRFNLLAMVRDLRIRAREMGDLEGLQREEKKRSDWQFENALRRHNFVGFAGEVLKGVVRGKVKQSPQQFTEWVDEAKRTTRKRMEEGKKKKGGAEDDDVEMGD